MAQVVRWLGAFRKIGDGTLAASAAWELTQSTRAVACEPLVRGKSRIAHARIGLVVDTSKSRLVRAWLCDAWTKPTTDGRLVTTKLGREWKGRRGSFDAFLKYWAHTRTDWHGELAVKPVYRAVAVSDAATKRQVALAESLADELNLPLEVVPDA